MSHAYANELLKISISQISHNIGWSNVQSSPLDILVDVYRRYITEISKSLKNYSLQYNRTEPNLDDLGLSFRDLGITLHDIKEYINNVEPVPPLYKVVAFPVKHLPNLQQPKPDCRELLVRPDHIPGYLPPMHPDLEEDGFSQQLADVSKKDINVNGDSHSPLSSPKHGLKRSDWTSDTSNKKSKYYSEEEGRPMREVTSVFMTPTGFVSPVHEGKSADCSLPCLVDSPPPTPEPSHSKKDGKSKDKKDKSKSKKDKSDTSKKDLKKSKSSKKEKENKENTVSKHEKSLASSSCGSSSKKEHKSSKSDKGMKSDDTVVSKSKSKSEKMKLKVQKDDLKKSKDPFKAKTKSKMKHSGGSGSSHVKSPKVPSSKKFKAVKVDKMIKQLKSEKTKAIEPLPRLPPPPPPKEIVPKEVPAEPKPVVVESKIQKEDIVDDDELDFREESPERLVIDDSLETQQRQERESRLEVIDRCIDAVIQRGAEETEVDSKAPDETPNSSARAPSGLRVKLEAKDIYDFTDTSESSSLSSCDIALASPPAKKEKKEKKSSSSPSNKKKKVKKKRPKNKSPSFSPPRPQKSPSFMLRVEDRTPSPILKDDLLSSDGSTPSSSPRSNSFFDNPTQPTTPMLSNVPPAPFGGSATFASSPFAPMQPVPSHLQSSFPTPPLFVTNSKSETSFQNSQPMNLAASGLSKTSPDKFEAALKDNSELLKKAANISKNKDHKKERNKKKGKKELEKVKEEIKVKPKEKPKAKPEKVAKLDKKKAKPEKKKGKEDKIKEDSTVPKMTLKLSSEAGSTKIVVKPNSKNSTPLSSSSSPDIEDEMDEDMPMSPAPSPPRQPSPPPPRVLTPVVPPKEETVHTPVKTPPTRGRGRGRKSAAPALAVIPPARTVITETVGTIVDESGNKIWICPACTRPDDGSPMIGCDECDDWYHWVCVGIVVPPKEEENWFCDRCIMKRQGPAIKRRRKKHKKEK